jgi:hypothetical protein
MTEQMQPLGGAGEQSTIEAGPLVHLHFVPSRMLWRIGPAWAVVAGAVAAGVSLGNAASLLRLATAVILADFVWGFLRRIIPDAPEIEGTTELTAPSLPYGRSDAPLSRFLQTIASGQHVSSAPWLGWLGTLALAVVLSLLLGAPTLLLSAIAVGMILLARALFRSGRRPAFCLALLDVALPWTLGAALIWQGLEATAPSWLAETGILAAAFTALQWGLYRAQLSAGRHLIALYFGQALLAAVLIVLRQPWAVAVSALLLAPPTWWLTRRDATEASLARSLPWWWAAMLSVAAIVR